MHKSSAKKALANTEIPTKTLMLTKQQKVVKSWYHLQVNCRNV